MSSRKRISYATATMNHIEESRRQAESNEAAEKPRYTLLSRKSSLVILKPISETKHPSLDTTNPSADVPKSLPVTRESSSNCTGFSSKSAKSSNATTGREQIAHLCSPQPGSPNLLPSTCMSPWHSFNASFQRDAPGDLRGLGAIFRRELVDPCCDLAQTSIAEAGANGLRRISPGVSERGAAEHDPFNHPEPFFPSECKQSRFAISTPLLSHIIPTSPKPQLPAYRQTVRAQPPAAQPSGNDADTPDTIPSISGHPTAPNVALLRTEHGRPVLGKGGAAWIKTSGPATQPYSDPRSRPEWTATDLKTLERSTWEVQIRTPDFQDSRNLQSAAAKQIEMAELNRLEKRRIRAERRELKRLEREFLGKSRVFKDKKRKEETRTQDSGQFAPRTLAEVAADAYGVGARSLDLHEVLDHWHWTAFDGFNRREEQEGC